MKSQNLKKRKGGAGSSTSTSISQEVNRRLADYRTARTPQKKLRATSALGLLALISSFPDETQAARLLKALKKLDKKAAPKQI